MLKHSYQRKKVGVKKMQQAKDKTDNSVNSPDEHMHKILG